VRRSGLLVKAAALALFGAGAAGAGVHWALSPRDPSAAEVVFTVAPGASLGAISRQLEQAGLVRNARTLAWTARALGLNGALRSGEYALSAAQSPVAILSQLAGGRTITYRVVVPEGFTAEQIGARLAAAGLVR
jgi:UPF0755 protein